MAQAIESFTFSGGSSYDIKTWFNGKVWGLVEGEDFTCKPASLRSQLVNAARKRNLSLRTSTIKTEGGNLMIVVQAKPKDAEAAAAPPADAPADADKPAGKKADKPKAK